MKEEEENKAWQHPTKHVILWGVRGVI